MSRFETPKTNKKKKKFVLLITFCLTFGGTIFVISEFLKNYSPAVDVNIGQENVVEDESDFYQEANIDDRLKWIQFEDNVEDSPVVAEVQENDDNTVKILDKIADKKTDNQKQISKQPKEEPVFSPQNIYQNDAKTNYNVPKVDDEEPPVPIMTEIKPQPKPTPVNTRTTRVYVGYYSSMTEATKIKNLICSEFPSYSPVIKNVNGQYIVQIGTFSDRTKAVILQMDLSDRGYPARLQTI